MTITPRERELVLAEREECARAVEAYSQMGTWTASETRPAIASAIRSRPQPSAPTSARSPTGWYRGRKDASTADGPGEWHVDYCHGDDRPEGDGWIALYEEYPPPAHPDIFIHATPKCDHEFAGWRDFEDGNGGEQICTKCGMGAMSASLRDGP